MNLLKYSNGVGHLIMSILVFGAGLVLLLWPSSDATLHGLGIGMVLTVQSAWFVPGAAKQVGQSVVSALSDQKVTINGNSSNNTTKP